MNAESKIRGYSADVRMQLNVNGFVLPIGQLGPDFIILRNAPEHPPAEAEIVMSIDGEESRWMVHLPEGISAKNELTKIA
jgi:hypothetical protein